MALWADRLAKLAQALATAGTVPDTSISTAETDVDLRLAPDGAGGVEWGTGGGGGTTFAPSLRMEIYDDAWFTATTARHDGGIVFFATGTSATSAASASLVGHPGVIQHTTGSTAAGLAGMVGQGVVLGGGEFTFGNIYKLDTLSDGTQTYLVRFGISDSTGLADPGRGVFFRYTDAVNTGKWEAVTRSGAVETATDTGITADTNYHRYEFVVNAGATSVEFFIDGTSVATNTTNIPTLLTNMMPTGVFKSLGTSARTVKLDAYWYTIDPFTTPR